MTGSALALVLVALISFVPGGSMAHEATVARDAMDVRPLTEGMPIPDGLVLRTRTGENYPLSEALRGEPTVLLFYRGGWCPFCNAHLGEISQIEEELRALGYRLIALSPDRPAEAEDSAFEYGDVMTLLSDSDMDAARAFGLAFRVSDEVIARYEQYGIDLEAASGRDHLQLPVPAAFVITDGVIRLAYVNPDYRTRVDADVLLMAARKAQRPE